MKYRYYQVNSNISDYVRTVLVLNHNMNSKSSNLPLFTNGMPALLCRTHNDRCLITLFGQFVPDELWTIDENTTLIALFFQPFSIGPIFKLPAQELKEQPIDINLWDAQKAMALNLQTLCARSEKERIEILSHFIHTQIVANRRDCELIRYATDTLMQTPNTDALTQLPKDLHLTERTFQRIFKKYVGATPGQYRRICQFYFAFSQLKDGPLVKQTDVAYANGYFDQSHFIRSFKEFTETTPNDYLINGLSGQKQ